MIYDEEKHLQESLEIEEKLLQIKLLQIANGRKLYKLRKSKYNINNNDNNNNNNNRSTIQRKQNRISFNNSQ